VVHVVTGAIVVLGLAAGTERLLPEGPFRLGPQRVPLFGNDYVDALTGWDGQWYVKIATEGYQYDPRHQSSVAFFPAYPVLVAMVHEATSLPVHIAGLVVSHGFLIGALVLMGVYAAGRGTALTPGPSPKGRGDSALTPCPSPKGRGDSALTPTPSPASGRGELLVEPEEGDRHIFRPEAGRKMSQSPARWFVWYTVLALALFPTSFFMRMVYTESLFLFLILLVFVGMQRKWPLAVIAIIAGAATATRSVGVALLVPFAWHVWEREKGDRPGEKNGAHTSPGERGQAPFSARNEPKNEPVPSLGQKGTGTSRTRSQEEKGTGTSRTRSQEEKGTGTSRTRSQSPFLRLAWLAPLAAWGLLAYMAFQWWAFGEPLAFAKTQQFWSRRPPEPFGERVLALLAWEPIWSVYTPRMPGYWGSIDRGVWMPFSYQLANANLFLLAIGLVVVGAAKKWLSVEEVIFAAALIGIPYMMSGFRFCMGSQGRFVSVVFPIYLVLGHILCRLPVAASVAVLALSAAYLALFSAMLASGYSVV
jgi:hypothetical protein